MQLNRIGFAREIFNGEEDFTPSQLEKILEIALIENKPEFVELLLQNGADLKSFLTYGRLYYLYNSVKIQHDSKRAPLFEICKMKYNLEDDKIFITFKDIRHVVKHFTFEDLKLDFMPKDLELFKEDDIEIEMEFKEYLVIKYLIINCKPSYLDFFLKNKLYNTENIQDQINYDKIC